VSNEADLTDPADDPDFISSDGPMEPTIGGPGFHPSSMFGAPAPVFAPKKSTRLEEDDPEGLIPPAPLWAMKYHCHFHLFDRTENKIRQRLGTGDHALYVIDEGRTHCVVSRIVGASPDDCTYCLVARITMESYDRLTNQEAPIDRAFADARDIAMCAVFETGVEDAASNVSVAESYATIDDVPPDYLSPHPFIDFEDTPDGTG